MDGVVECTRTRANAFACVYADARACVARGAKTRPSCPTLGGLPVVVGKSVPRGKDAKHGGSAAGGKGRSREEKRGRVRARQRAACATIMLLLLLLLVRW